MKTPVFQPGIQILLLLAGIALLKAETYLGTNSSEVHTGTAGNDRIMMGDGDDTVTAGGGDDLIWGDDGADLLSAGPGNDVISGGSMLSPADTAANAFFGGEGNDILMGGLYGDLYHYNLGDGFDIIREPGSVANEVDKIVFGPGISASSLTFGREKADLFVELSGGDIVRIRSWFGSSSGEFRIEEFQFDSDPTLQGATLPFEGTTWNGTSGNDVYFASGTENFWLLGAAGNDTLAGNSGMDVLVGGTGTDVLYGGAGDDGVYGEADNDVLYGEDGEDTLDGAAGDDTLLAGDGNDTLIGGEGNDTLYGSSGNDIYSWALGDGEDLIQDDTGYYGANSVNHLAFAAGILPVDVSLESVPANGNHLKFVIRNGGVVNGSVTVNYWSKTHDYSWMKHSSTWRIEFADGTVWNGGTLGTPLSDTIIGDGSANTLSGAAGADMLYGLDGNDVLNGGDDNDTLYGGEGDDSLTGGSGNDTLFGEWGNDTLLGGSDNDVLYGGTGADLLAGGAGDDTIIGEEGNDVYQWNPGDGSDQLHDSTYEYGPAVENRLDFGAGIAPSDVEMSVVGSYSLKFRVLDSNRTEIGSATINNWYAIVAGGIQHRQAWKIRFANGTVWDGKTMATPAADFLAGGTGNDAFSGGDGNDTLSGNDGNDSLSGDDGADTLYGNAGNDVLNGGTGADILGGGEGNDLLLGNADDDLLFGEEGNDSYQWNIGDGNDQIFDSTYEYGPGVENQLVFGAGIVPSDIEMAVAGSYGLKFMVKDSNNAINGSMTVSNWYATVAGGIQHRQVWKILFANGTVWDGKSMGTPGTDVLSGGTGNDTLSGAAGNDTLVGNDGDDLLSGDDGADALYGNAGNDVLNGGADSDSLVGGSGDDALRGGAGDDVLNGEDGSDTYFWSQGSGDDMIAEGFWETGVENTLAIEGVIDPGSIDFAREASTRLKISVPGSGSSQSSSISIESWAASSGASRFFSIWKLDIGLYGVFRFGNLPTTGYDTAIGTSSGDLLIGLEGDDSLAGADEADFLSGGAGSDSLEGDDGDDLLAGGTGNDSLSGGDGSDIYYVNQGGGEDTISEPASQVPNENNQLVFGPGIDPNILVVTWSSGDLLIQYETNGFVRIANWFADQNRARAIETVKFSSGIIWSRDYLENRIQTSGSGGGGGSPHIADLIPLDDLNDALEGYTTPQVVSLEVLTPLQ